MSGHSKWATIKHKKGATDAKRGKLFSKLVKEITVAARMGGGDVNANPRLRLAVNNAKRESMPNKNIENAIKKGSGEDKEGVIYQEVTYEGYAPAGVAIMVECLTENKNRTVAAVRTTFGKNGGNMGESGSVAWQFEKQGVINIEKQVIEEEKLMELAIEAGAEDVLIEEEGYTVYTALEAFHVVYDILKKADIEFVNAEVMMVPKNLTPISTAENEKVERLVSLLDDLDDVRSVSSNATVNET